MRGVRVRDAGSPFAGSTQPAVSGASALGRTASLWALGAIALLLAAAVFPSSADAAVIHKPAGSFDIYSGDGWAGPPTSIGVDEQGGYLYVLGRFGGQLEKLDHAKATRFRSRVSPGRTSAKASISKAAGSRATRSSSPARTARRATGEIEWTTEQPALENNIKAGLEAKCGGPLKVTGEGGDSRNFDIEFEGSFGHADLPQISCAKVSGSGTCFATGGAAPTARPRPTN